MRYMVIEKFRQGPKAVYERLASRGRMLPDGLRYLDSWLQRDGQRCFQLMETDHPELFEPWTERWNDLVDFEIVEVDASPTASSDGDRI